MQIYLARNNQQAGPYTLEQVNQMLSSQQVLLTDLAWHEGMSEWKTLGELTHGQLVYKPLQSEQTTPPPSNNFNPQPDSHQNETISNIEVQQGSNKTKPAAAVSKRIYAKIIDLALLIIPQLVITAFFLPYDLMAQASSMSVEEQIKIAEAMRDNMPQWVAYALIAYTLALLFLQNFLIARSGQSVGKKLFKLQILDVANNKLPGQFRGFFIRSFLFIVLSQLLVAMPFLILIFIVDLVLFFSKGNNSLHDRLARTKVVDLSK